jgi:hypothetical protein
MEAFAAGQAAVGYFRDDRLGEFLCIYVRAIRLTACFVCVQGYRCSASRWIESFSGRFTPRWYVYLDILVRAIRRLTSCLVSSQVALVLFVATRALTARH